MHINYLIPAKDVNDLLTQYPVGGTIYGYTVASVTQQSRGLDPLTDQALIFVSFVCN